MSPATLFSWGLFPSVFLQPKIKIQNIVSFIYILAFDFDPEERIASNFSLEYHKDKGNYHYVKKLKDVKQIHLSAPYEM